MTMAGNGSPGDSYGLGINSQLNTPYGVTVDWSGKVFIMDSGNYKIKLLDRNWNLLRFSGTGTRGTTVGNADICEYVDLKFADVDKTGNIYVVDFDEARGSRILKVDQNGKSALVKDFQQRNEYCVIAVTAAYSGYLFVTESIFELSLYSSSSSSLSSSSSSSSSSISSSSSSSIDSSSSSSYEQRVHIYEDGEAKIFEDSEEAWWDGVF